MKKKLFTMVLCCVLTLAMCVCGVSGAETSSSETGLFSGVGGWKAEEGIIFILNNDGSGAMLSEVKFEGDASNAFFPSVLKTDISWEEDTETVTITMADSSFPLQKNIDGEKETLEGSGVVYAKLSEEEINEYKEKAGITSDSAESNNTSDSESEPGLIEFTDTILLDNELITVELTQFFEDEVFWAWSNDPQMEKYVTLKVHNNSDKEILFNLDDAYINDESVSVLMKDGNQGPAPGKTKTYTYDIQYNTSPNPKALDSIDDLYTLDANIQTFIYDGDYLTDESNTRFCINDVINSTDDNTSDEASQESTVSAEDVDAILQGTWMLDDNTFSFNNGSANIFSSGNELSGTYVVNTGDATIDVELETSDGAVSIHMPYEYSDGTLILKNNRDVELTKQ